MCYITVGNCVESAVEYVYPSSMHTTAYTPLFWAARANLKILHLRIISKTTTSLWYTSIVGSEVRKEGDGKKFAMNYSNLLFADWGYPRLRVYEAGYLRMLCDAHTYNSDVAHVNAWHYIYACACLRKGPSHVTVGATARLLENSGVAAGIFAWLVAYNLVHRNRKPTRSTRAAQDATAKKKKEMLDCLCCNRTEWLTLPTSASRKHKKQLNSWRKAYCGTYMLATNYLTPKSKKKQRPLIPGANSDCAIQE